LKFLSELNDDNSCYQKAVSHVHSGSEATGVGHVLANKGGVCISFKVCIDLTGINESSIICWSISSAQELT